MKNFRQFIATAADKKKDKIPDQATSQILYPTGFMYLDYINGSFAVSYDDDENPCGLYHNIGVMNGSLNIIIGKSQVGKSTIATKMAVGILETWMNSVIRDHMGIQKLNPGIEFPAPLLHYIDVEKTMSADYIKKMSGYRNKELKAILELTRASTYDDVQQALKWHCRYKETNMSPVKMPMNDVYGNPIVAYPPTVMILDSTTQINSDDTDTAEDEGFAHATQMTAGARRAQMIGKLNTMLMNMAKKYNIIVFEISHINQQPQMTMMPPAKQYRALKPGETIAGGEKQLYLATSILRLDQRFWIGTEKASMKNFGEGVTGFITDAQFIKTKSNAKGSVVQLVYTEAMSYDPFLSTAYFAMQTGDLKKVGNNYILDDYPDYKFNIKNIVDVFAENPKLIPAFYDQMVKKLTKYLGSYELGSVTSGQSNNNDDNDDLFDDPLADIELF